MCGLFALLTEAFAKSVSSQPASSDAAYEALDAYIQRQMDRLSIPAASLAIVEGDRIVHQRGFGQVRTSGEAPSPQTPFLIGSLTKSFTALAVMQLVEAGKVELDAPVQRYLPWFRVADAQASAEMTVRHLLNQTSGLSSTSGWSVLSDFDDGPDALEVRVRALSAWELAHPPGAAFEYSDSNYNVLGLIVQTVSGEPYAEYVQNHIFTPLDMVDSYVSKELAKQHGLPVGHQLWFWVPVARPGLKNPGGSLPSGQLISSAEDMGHYLIALLNGGRYAGARILSEAGVAELQRGVAEHVDMGISVGKYGMGWYASDAGSTQVLWHTGMVPDFAAYMALIPEQRKGVVLLMNADHFLMSPILSEMGAGVAALLAGETPAPLRFGFLPWATRGLLLIPVLQVLGVIATLHALRSWRESPGSRPRGLRKWGLYVVPPLILNGLVALMLLPLRGAMRGFWLLFAPDYAWIALISGTFALLWGPLRTWLVLRRT